MGCSPDHPADGQVAPGRADPWRKVVPARVGCDARNAFPAGRQHLWDFCPGRVSIELVPRRQSSARSLVVRNMQVSDRSLKEAACPHLTKRPGVGAACQAAHCAAPPSMLALPDAV